MLGSSPFLSAKANCVSDYLNFATTTCQVSANCGATAPTIVATNPGSQFQSCSVSPLLKLTATNITLSAVVAK